MWDSNDQLRALKLKLSTGQTFLDPKVWNLLALVGFELATYRKSLLLLSHTHFHLAKPLRITDLKSNSLFQRQATVCVKMDWVTQFIKQTLIMPVEMELIVQQSCKMAVAINQTPRRTTATMLSTATSRGRTKSMGPVILLAPAPSLQLSPVSLLEKD